ncbi:MAG: invasion associated locus B family protein [Rhizobiaceae bacterium]|nr:invasion associated locus B family protein [Rhizobiaceae bacterium]|tara:strand:- start:59373 stop:59951 length:579 start_codon:yes stop_codon:yes gene_type:complete
MKLPNLTVFSMAFLVIFASLETVQSFAAQPVQYAQANTKKAAKGSQPAAEAKKPDGSNWVVTCTGTGSSDAMRCELIQQIFLKDSNQRLLRFALIPQPKAGKDVLSLALPHGLNLRQGVRMQIDDSAPITVPYAQSDNQGVYAVSLMEDNLLAALKRGNSLKVMFDTVEGKTVTVTISLIGFSAAHAKYSAG